jgi:hypothetical protein
MNPTLAIHGCAAAVLFVLCAPAAAATYAVGAGAGCTHATIQAAIAAAEASPGADTIRISRSASWNAQALTVNTSQELTLAGGFATCTDAAADDTATVINGAGGATEPVLRITIGTGGVVRLQRLTIQGGDEDGTGHGGGIFFRGNGRLELHESSIVNNLAGYGGGIYAEGTGSGAELVIGADVVISGNTARYSGGGVYVDGMRMTMLAPGSAIAFNIAEGTDDSGYGGGLIVLSRNGAPAHATIGSGGIGTLGTIFGNSARYGGGIAAVAATDSGSAATVHVYSTEAGRATAVRDNFASVVGGGVYTAPFYREAPTLRIGPAAVLFWHADLTLNAAPDGAAAYHEHDTALFGAVAQGSASTFNVGAPPADALPCPLDAPCGRIAGNIARNAASQATGGAIFRVTRDSRVAIGSIAAQHVRGGVLVASNQGGRLVDAGADTSIELRNVAVTDNSFTAQLVRATGGDSQLELVDATVAGNTLGAVPVLLVDGNATLTRSILWQPGRTSLSHVGGTRSVVHVLASETASLGGGPGAVAADPRFIDPPRADYRLRAASPAIDFAPAVAGDDRDVNGRPRDQRINIVPRVDGLVRDIGAYERQTLQPLVLNGHFDTDLRLWSVDTAGAASWDGSRNAPASTGGAVAVNLSDAPQARVSALSQCVQLPGPSVYRLNGSGLSTGLIGSRDTVLLQWEYRRNGGPGCTAGAPDASGDHVLGTATSWTRPVEPALIEVPESEWNHQSSITISLVVIDNAQTFPRRVTGWFDHVTLEPGGEVPPRPDFIFRDGFE